MEIAKPSYGHPYLSVGEISKNTSGFKTYHCRATTKNSHATLFFFSIWMKQYKYNLYSESKPNFLKVEE